MNVFEIKEGYFTVWDGKTKYNYEVEPGASNDKFKFTLDAIYLYCQLKGMTGEETIDYMLRHFHKRRIIKVGHLVGLSLCWVFIGVRGSGKSVGATQVAVIDGLLAGRKVVSNMPIQVKVKYKDAEKVFETEDLDAVSMLDINEFNDNYEDCMIVIDESNLNIADAMRSTTNQALYFGMILQQMRHRKLDFVMTTQDEGFNTKRARTQVDLYIRCKDKAMVKNNGTFIRPKIDDLGRKSEWSLYDMSGVITGEIKRSDTRTQEISSYKQLIVWNTPFWNCYSTELMQKWEKIRLNTTGEKRSINTSYFDSASERFNIPVDLLIASIDFNNERILKDEIWEKLTIEDNITMKRRIGKLYTQIGINTIKSNSQRYFIYPSKLEIVRNLKSAAIEHEMEKMNE